MEAPSRLRKAPQSAAHAPSSGRATAYHEIVKILRSAIVKILRSAAIRAP
jgi:hypothetical protein